MVNKFELEQLILGCWNICDDVQLLYENVLESDELTKDEVANILLGLKTLYHLKFKKCFDTFEKLTDERKVT